MTTTIIILIVLALLGLGGGVVAWFLLQRRQAVKIKEPPRQEPARETAKGGTLPFRWRYIIAPIAILVLSVILTAFFSPRLPPEVAYHFAPDGSPDKWLSRGGAIAWAVAPQFFLTLLAGAITWGTIKLSTRAGQLEGAWIKPERLLSIMGNMIALPQIILLFAMLNIFSYNSYQTQLMPVWIFALTIMVLGGVILGIFFIQAIRRAWATNR
jgi:uncharacterized membrane protein